MLNSLTVVGAMMSTSLAGAKENFRAVRFQELIKKKPDIEGASVRVWTIKQDNKIRVNLVEFSGEQKLHRHPDAEHSLMVLEGSVRVQIDKDVIIANKGDFISVPANVPHKYWPIGEKVILVSMDAPYYDPAKTVLME